jgi:hypothetical protein
MGYEKNIDQNRTPVDLYPVPGRLLTEKLFRGEFHPAANGADFRRVKHKIKT